MYHSLRKNCPYLELLWSAFSRIRTEYGETRNISPYLVRMRENAEQNNFEWGHFLRSDCQSNNINREANMIRESNKNNMNLHHEDTDHSEKDFMQVVLSFLSQFSSLIMLSSTHQMH